VQERMDDVCRPLGVASVYSINGLFQLLTENCVGPFTFKLQMRSSMSYKADNRWVNLGIDVRHHGR